MAQYNEVTNRDAQLTVIGKEHDDDGREHDDGPYALQSLSRLDMNTDPCGHVKGSNIDHNGRFRSPLTLTSCSTFNGLASLNMA
ncbi:hypothetical protein JHK87_008188 [Glycine soja]|nr:hypothetical protein JHK87_008188 [Glycine soja]